MPDIEDGVALLSADVLVVHNTVGIYYAFLLCGEIDDTREKPLLTGTFPPYKVIIFL